MGLIVELTVRTPLMEHTRQSVPEMQFKGKDLQLSDSGPTKYVFWATGEGFNRLEPAMEADPTIEAFTLISEESNRRLYRLVFSREADEHLVYPVAIDSDIVFLRWTSKGDISRVRARVPDRETLQAFRRDCEERGVSFQLDRIYEEDTQRQNKRYGLTDSQREALVLAYREGYFEAERKATLEDIAGGMDISRQALAGRLRRGHQRLIENTLLHE